MEREIKKLSNYPVTVTSAVFLDNTSKSLQQAIDDGSLTEDLKQYSSKLITYKGEFDPTLNANDYNDGDFWIYKGDSYTINAAVIFYNDIVYVKKTRINKRVDGEWIAADGNIFQSIHRKQECGTSMKQKYDIIIVGAGAGGIGAAYALKDSGYRVALIERNDRLGGTHCHTTGLLIANPVGNWYKNICQQAYDQGYMEFYKFGSNPQLVGEGTNFERGWRGSFFCDPKNIINNYQGNHININGVWFSKKYKSDLEGSIDIFKNHEVRKVNSDGTKIYEIVAVNLLNSKEKIFIADWFIDASADAILATKNEKLVWGEDYYSGTDGYARFLESTYGSNEEPDPYAINTVEPCIYRYSNGIQSNLEYTGDMKLKKYSEINTWKGNYDWEPPNGHIKISSASYSTHMNTKDFLTKSNEYNLADGYDRARYLCNQNAISNPFTDASRFVGCPDMLAIRESFRYSCDKTVDQTYLTKQITSSNIEAEKIMALSTWYVDIHNQSYYCISNIANGIPYESMIPKFYTNVLVASRCYGSSHLALSSIRLVKSMLDLGYSAGKAMIDILDNNKIDVRDADTIAIQTATGIKDSMEELETYFYVDTVDYTTATN